MSKPFPLIKDVWANNLEEEMEKIRNIVDKYPYVAMVCSILEQEEIPLIF